MQRDVLQAIESSFQRQPCDIHRDCPRGVYPGESIKAKCGKNAKSAHSLHDSLPIYRPTLYLRNGWR